MDRKLIVGLVCALLVGILTVPGLSSEFMAITQQEAAGFEGGLQSTTHKDLGDDRTQGLPSNRNPRNRIGISLR